MCQLFHIFNTFPYFRQYKQSAHLEIRIVINLKKHQSAVGGPGAGNSNVEQTNRTLLLCMATYNLISVL